MNVVKFFWSNNKKINKNEVNKENWGFLSALQPQKMPSECDQPILVCARLNANRNCKAVGDQLPLVQANYPDMSMVFQQVGAPEKAPKRLRSGWRTTCLSGQRTCGPLTHQMPTQWTSIFGCMLRACTVCHKNINALKDTVNQHWDNMSEDHICNGCKAFRGCLEAIIAAKGAIHQCLG